MTEHSRFRQLADVGVENVSRSEKAAGCDSILCQKVCVCWIAFRWLYKAFSEMINKPG